MIYLKYLKAEISYQGIQRIESYSFPKERDRKQTEQYQHLNSTQQRIISMILLDPRITQKEMAAQIGLSTEAIKKNIRILKEKGILNAQGPRRTQVWKLSDSKNVI